MFKKLRQKQDGDTIVEVLISLAILTLVLGGAYFTANQSYRNDRDAQEHSEAMTIAQSQLESLRTYGDSFVNDATDACFDNSGSTQSPSSCSFNSSGTSCSASSPYCYTAIITGPTTNTYNFTEAGSPLSVNFNTYKIQVSWDALGGGKDYVSLFYRVDST